MPPKPKFTKEEIVEAAVEIVRREGEDALTARSLGKELNASARPIFTVFKNMEEVKAAVQKRVEEIFFSYRERMIVEGKYPKYKAIGLAYIRFASEEKNLFQLHFMRDRTTEIKSEKDGYDDMVETTIVDQTGLKEQDGYLFHLENWIFVHGIASMMVTSYSEWDFELISRMMTDIYEGLKLRYPHAAEKPEGDGSGETEEA